MVFKKDLKTRYILQKQKQKQKTTTTTKIIISGLGIISEAVQIFPRRRSTTKE